MSIQHNESRQEYIKRINEVLDFIEKNLDSNLSLEQLSQKAHYSSFHFHRIFSVIVGETLNSYTNRKRIERVASILLVGTEVPLNELAYKYGFNNSNSFSRAFKKYYGISPTEFKIKGEQTLRKIGIDFLTLEKYICSINNIKKWIDMNAQIEVKRLQEIKLAGIAHIGEFDQINISYEKLFTWLRKKEWSLPFNFKAVTVYHDNPKVTQESKVRLSVCATINEDIEAEGEVRPLSIQEGAYAIGRFEIAANVFQKAWDSMCIWVLENAYCFRDGDYFEVYHNDAKTHPEQKFIVDICIPIKKERKEKGMKLTRLEDVGGKSSVNYSQQFDYFKKLRAYFVKEYDLIFTVGTIYQGSIEYAYFSLKTDALKQQKLKFVIVWSYQEMQFKICLSGQNKTIRKTYWEVLKNSDWDKYNIAKSIDDSLSIIDHVIVEQPNFDDLNLLTDQIEAESMKFMNEINAILELS